MGAFFIFFLNRFIYRISEFIRRWYLESARFYTHFIISLLEKLDGTFALKITWRHFGEPLYQDRTIFGYIFGFIFRSIRLFIGAFIYGVLITLAVIIFVVWALIPFYIIANIIGYDFSENVNWKIAKLF
ncbi:hypothetical protein COV23_00620 [Candidatus Wolfebacteria bacterium CG10_big_fil_rev_8_21_14_0_10_31_9]|uniref:Uncharacterized protein n=1 Tax=Candidatus Wolfebacteria bacterium CG10_big_fil_rev_8_21_14_0_10_31_9 TaxID=1975070 RepID=A0A2H0RCT5_9BACT|nr:MAG: hypothetical protein COV23_00620 [Candidatus Wolfebacteria bacterium CG10_big_fil_rev_8_21_14_0_10_31_9]